MKKLLSIVLAMLMVFSMAVVASAESTTTLTTTVPAATYTLNIPADQHIEFGSFQTNIGTPTISNGLGFANGKNVKVSVSYSAFTSNEVPTTIPFSLWLITEEKEDAQSLALASGETLIFNGQYDGTVEQKARASFKYNDNLYGPMNESCTVDGIYVEINSEAWGKALAGEYTATITFTAEVVVE